MRIEHENVSRKEDVFKSIIKKKSNKNECKNTSDISDEEEAYFLRKIKSVHGKYKCKFPFKHFKCGRIGHFLSKCTFK